MISDIRAVTSPSSTDVSLYSILSQRVGTSVFMLNSFTLPTEDKPRGQYADIVEYHNVKEIGPCTTLKCLKVKVSISHNHGLFLMPQILNPLMSDVFATICKYLAHCL